MRNRLQLKTGTFLAGALVAVGLLAGCGSSDSDEPTTTGTTMVTGTTGATAVTGATGAEATTGSTGDTSPGNGTDAKKTKKKQKGHNPASAKDKRGKAPDDVISERPGGPGTAQPSP